MAFYTEYVLMVVNRAVVNKLFEVCNWTHETWLLYKALFDDNIDLERLKHGRHAYFLNALNSVLQEYVLLQIAKLHDPAVMNGRTNLSLAYIVEHGGWEPATIERLRELKNRLDALNAKIRPARNRVLSHHDLETLMKDRPVGGFPKDSDVEYFRVLHEFVSCVSQRVIGAGCAEFARFTQGDADGVIRALLSPSVLSDESGFDAPPEPGHLR